jgi:hypothetical protein
VWYAQGKNPYLPLSWPHIWGHAKEEKNARDANKAE